MQINRIDKKAELNILDIVKYQIITYCYFEKIAISDAAALCLAHLAISGKVELNKFCNDMADRKIFATAQVVRNAIIQNEKRELVIKEDNKRKIVYLNPRMKVVHEGNILLDFKFLYREPVEGQNTV